MTVFHHMETEPKIHRPCTFHIKLENRYLILVMNCSFTITDHRISQLICIFRIFIGIITITIIRITFQTIISISWFCHISVSFCLSFASLKLYMYLSLFTESVYEHWRHNNKWNSKIEQKEQTQKNHLMCTSDNNNNVDATLWIITFSPYRIIRFTHPSRTRNMWKVPVFSIKTRNTGIFVDLLKFQPKKWWYNSTTHNLSLIIHVLI